MCPSVIHSKPAVERKEVIIKALGYDCTSERDWKTGSDVARRRLVTLVTQPRFIALSRLHLREIFVSSLSRWFVVFIFEYLHWTITRTGR